MFYREAGQYKASYQSDQAIFPIAQDRFAMLALLFLLVRPQGLFGERIIERV